MKPRHPRSDNSYPQTGIRRHNAPRRPSSHPTAPLALLAQRVSFFLTLATVALTPAPVISIGSGQIDSVSQVALILALMAAFIAYFYKPTNPAISLELLFMLGFVGLTSASILWSIDPPATYHRTLAMAELTSLALLIIYGSRTLHSLNFIAVSYLVGCLTSISNLLFNVVADKPFTETANAAERRFSATGIDPNDLAVMISIGIVIAGLLARHTQGRTRRVFILFILLACVAIILTGSRTGLTTMITALLFTGLPFRQPTRRQIMLAWFLLPTILFATALVTPGTVWERLSEVPDNILHFDFTGRGEIWRAGIDLVTPGRVVMGNGAGTFRTALAARLGTDKSPHNTFVSIFAELGSAGVLVFGFILLPLIVGTLRNTNPINRRHAVGLLIIWFIASIFLAWEYRKPTWFLFAFVSKLDSLCVAQWPHTPLHTSCKSALDSE